MEAFTQLKQNAHSTTREARGNREMDGHPETDQHYTRNDEYYAQDDHHNSNDHDDTHDKEYETIRAEHKRVALEFYRELEERRQRNKELIGLTGQKARAASKQGNKFCKRVQKAITPQDELYDKRVHKFYKAQDYYEQKRDDYFAKHNEWLSKLDSYGVLMDYAERVEDYCANVDIYSIEEDAKEFSALLDAHEEVVPLRHEKDAAMAELAMHARIFVQTVDLLIRWQLERRHYMAKPTDDINNANVPHPTPVIMNFYHYR
jgi:hypothetical protein